MPGKIINVVFVQNFYKMSHLHPLDIFNKAGSIVRFAQMHLNLGVFLTAQDLQKSLLQPDRKSTILNLL